ERRPWSQDEKHSKARGNALPAAEAEREGKHVTGHGKERGKGLRVARRRGDGEIAEGERAQPHGRGALQDVQQKGGRAQSLAAGAQHVGGADVAAAYGANILMAENADEQKSRRD